ncbi:cation diffusion facilitator family transporter [Rhodocytophaga aerolata]|uniref:Cation diffusion facilitator family transporter n=1 Tax=Rhodocytophaga aerolata TaxID=455078 RepID=A0ABT8R7B2_9BACT|nr:cation diffusion facilitator family transporter [Rhodocytophaga aerolata]MDO1447993.1 cation diffusion facilitator family transporter [Rhodocytophaga aerolata]
MLLNESEKIHPSRKGLKSTIIGILLNALLAIIKGVAGVLGNSYALVADAIESSFDIFTSFITWVGLKTASKAPDEDHPYGHGKAEPLAAMVVSLSLIAAAILIAIQSIENIRTPHDPPAAFTLVVLALVVAVKEGLFRFVHKVGDEVASNAVKADAWHHRSDAITSATAFIGITIALIGGKGYESADDYAALIASVIIVFNAYRIFMPSFAEIMDKAPDGRLVEEVKEIALTVKGVQGIDKCFVRKMGFEYFVDIHVIVDGSLSVRTGHDIAHSVKNAVLQAKPTVYDVLTHIEPA